jgi:hypothetical protein
LNRVLAGVAAGLLIAFAAIGIVTGEGEEEAAPEASRGPPVAEIARGVERVRGLRFARLPRVREVSGGQARRDGLRELDRQVPRRRQEVEERLLKLLGLLPPAAGFRDVLGQALTGEVGGYYVPRTNTLALVRGAGLGAFADVVIAHELTHALEDQHFGLDLDRAASGLLSDRAGARTALHEGTATIAMLDYVFLTRGGGRDLPPSLRREVLDELESVTLPESSGLPRYVREALVFPYSAGAAFVDDLQADAGWEAVNEVFRQGGPASTEQVMHPEKYAAQERPLPVRVGDYRDALPAGARVVARGDLGEFDTAQFLREGNGRRRAERAAAGWGGSRLTLWRLPDSGDALVMSWTWDTPRDAMEFDQAARRTLATLATPGAIERGVRSVTVVLAPNAALAERVAKVAAH